MMPLSIRVAGPGVAPHSLPLDVTGEGTLVLKLGRSGRVVGIVRTASGVPLADVPVELWVQGADIRRNDFGESLPSRRITSDEIVRLDQDPLKTGAQGAFQTPSTLLYRFELPCGNPARWVRAICLRLGDAEWRTRCNPAHPSPAAPEVGGADQGPAGTRGRRRQGLPRGWWSSATTDAQGRFALVGNKPGKAVILVEQTGFRLQGWLIDPSSPAETGSLTLVRTSEAPGPVMKPLADPIPHEESRALADRLLEPYLHGPMENGNDEPRLTAILALSELDLDRALELLKNGEFRDDDRVYQLVRESWLRSLR